MARSSAAREYDFFHDEAALSPPPAGTGTKHHGVHSGYAAGEPPIPGIDRDLIVRCTAGGDCTYQLRRDWGRIGNRPGRNRLSQGSDGHFHFRAHLRYGNVDGERDLHQYRFSANAHCSASAKLKHSLKVRVPVCEPNGSKAQETIERSR